MFEIVYLIEQSGHVLHFHLTEDNKLERLFVTVRDKRYAAMRIWTYNLYIWLPATNFSLWQRNFLQQLQEDPNAFQ
jgi:hypothetical protein